MLNRFFIVILVAILLSVSSSMIYSYYFSISRGVGFQFSLANTVKVFVALLLFWIFSTVYNRVIRRL